VGYPSSFFLFLLYDREHDHAAALRRTLFPLCHTDFIIGQCSMFSGDKTCRASGGFLKREVPIAWCARSRSKPRAKGVSGLLVFVTITLAWAAWPPVSLHDKQLVMPRGKRFLPLGLKAKLEQDF